MINHEELVSSPPFEGGDKSFCAQHPGQATTLRCNRCEKLICAKCALRTPVGYRCAECVRGQQSVFETVLGRDYVVVAVVTLFASGLAGALLVRMGWFVIFLAPMAGGVIAELIRRAVRRRRGRYLASTAVGAMVLAAMPGLLSLNVWSLIYLVLAASTVYARLRVSTL